MELSAIQHEMNRNFVYRVSKNHYLFKLYAKKGDIKEVNLFYKEKYSFNVPSMKQTYSCITMKKVTSDDRRDYFEAIINIDYISVNYYFDIHFNDDNKILFSNNIFVKEIDPYIGTFQISQYVMEEDDYHVPEWSKNCIIYQIFPDRFSSSKLSDEEWEKLPSFSTNMLGGDLKGIQKRIPYLKSLNIDAIYLCPIFRSETYHKYSTTDYLNIDEGFGTNEDFKELVNECHKAGIRVIIDIVFNHSGTGLKQFVDVLENQENSIYKDWFLIKSFPIDKTSKEQNYKTFAYHKYMPKLNVQNPEVREFLFSVVKYWYKFAKVDGFRLDVADEVTHEFWKKFRKVVKEMNDDLLIIGERWLDSKNFLDHEWDTHMNYIYYFNVLALLKTKNIKMSTFVDRINFVRGYYPLTNYYSLWNLVGSHDTPRIKHVLGNNEKYFRIAEILNFLFDGSTFIYYGDEVGMTSNKDVDISSRAPMIWNEKLQNKDDLNLFKTMIKIKKEYLNKYLGRKEYVLINDDHGILVYKQYNEDESDYLLIAVNINKDDFKYNFNGELHDLITNAVVKNIIPSETIYILK